MGTTEHLENEKFYINCIKNNYSPINIFIFFIPNVESVNLTICRKMVHFMLILCEDNSYSHVSIYDEDYSVIYVAIKVYTAISFKFPAKKCCIHIHLTINSFIDILQILHIRSIHPVNFIKSCTTMWFCVFR